MARYAANTEVPSDRSIAEIKYTLSRYGAGAFGFLEATDPPGAEIVFVMRERRVRLTLPLPKRDEFRLTPTGRVRAPTQQMREYEQATRQRWRALALIVKANLEAVEAGIVTFDQAFLAHFVLDDGRTVDEAMQQDPERLLYGGKLALGPG